MPPDPTHTSRADISTALEKREAEDALEAKLMEGIHSIEHELAPAEWCDIQAEALAAVDARKKAC
jgi:antitoxin ParD1/3/4